MIVLMKHDAAPGDIEKVMEKVRSLGFLPHAISGSQSMTIGITGNKSQIDTDLFMSMSGVEDVIQVSKPYKLVSRDIKHEDTVIQVGEDEVGGKDLTVIAGPCSVESRSQILEIALMLSEMGVKFLRGGAYKPRTSPYSFQGLKEEGLEFLKEAAIAAGMHVITEVKDTETLPLIMRYADILQVGSRNMYNFSLLERIGEQRKPVLIKRAFSATIEELLMAGEYVAAKGNYQIIFCERGIRSFDPLTRNSLDLSAVPLVKKLSHFPIIVDPSHGTGSWDLVIPMSQAAVVAGADGLMIEVHPDPSVALSDGFQSLRPDKFKQLLERLRVISPIVGKTVHAPQSSTLVSNN